MIRRVFLTLLVVKFVVWLVRGPRATAAATRK